MDVDQENIDEPQKDTKAKGKKKAYTPTPGDLVFAKVKGYPYWPARVEANVPVGMKVGNGKFPVFFFGTYELATCAAKEIVPFEANKNKYGKSKAKKFLIGMKEIEESPNITSVPSTTLEQPISPDEGNSPAPENPSIENNVEDTPEPKAKEEKEPEKVVKEVPKRKSEAATKGGKRKKNEPATKNVQVIESEVSNNREDLERMKSEEEKKLKKLEQKVEEKEKLKRELKEKKLEKKRMERIEKLKTQPATTVVLTDLNTEIMHSLNIDSPDVGSCLQAMSKLDLIYVTQAALVKYPEILSTIKKCRKFKGDQAVRQKADYLYNKYKSMFSSGVDEAAQKLLNLNESSQDSMSSPKVDEAVKASGAGEQNKAQILAEKEQEKTPAHESDKTSGDTSTIKEQDASNNNHAEETSAASTNGAPEKV